ncbi:integrase, catalytic region [Agrobacterium sp. ATCC 31749]|nr:integrase, catalytic region [Agrobacterium sp. ATCC 31749]
MGSRRRRWLNQPTQSNVELHSFEVAPWSPAMDHFGLVKAVDRFGESVVVGIANVADRRLEYLIDTYWADSTGRRNTTNQEV